MPFDKDPNEIGAMWEKTAKNGKTYMTGTINGQRIVMFRAGKKSSDKAPDWRILKSVPQEARQTSEANDDF